MSQDIKNQETKKIIFSRKMSRREIIEAVTEPDSVIILGKDAPKTISIPPAASKKVDFEKFILDMDVSQDSLMYEVIRLFCEEKKASETSTKVFIMRIKNLNNEQLKVVGVLCKKNEFTSTNILNAIQSIKKFDATRLLALRAFVDLEGIDHSQLNQFFMTTLVQSSREEVGKEAYENEAKEKMMSPAQNNVFYNICYQINEIAPSDAIAILRKVRKLKLQHTEVINTFLKKDAVFGDDPINSDNILKLINLWLTLPELGQVTEFERLIKRISRKSKKQPDFKFIVQSFIKEIAKEKARGEGSFINRIFH